MRGQRHKQSRREVSDWWKRGYLEGKWIEGGQWESVRGTCAAVSSEARLEWGGVNRVWDWCQAVPEVMNEAIMKYLCSSASAAGWRITTALARWRDPLNHASRAHTLTVKSRWYTPTYTQIRFWTAPPYKANTLFMMGDPSFPTTHCIPITHTQTHIFTFILSLLPEQGLQECGLCKTTHCFVWQASNAQYLAVFHKQTCESDGSQDK